jgi:uncharacterized membrane protein
MIRRMFCHKCGTSAAPEAQFCPACGASLGPETSGLAGSPAVAWTPPAVVDVRGGEWIPQGWRLVKADMGSYMLLALIYSALGSVVPLVLQGPLMAGIYIFTMRKMVSGRSDIGDIFKGFNFFVPTLVASLLIGLFVAIGCVFLIIPGLVVAAMYGFTYLFIVDKRMDFWPAMQASHAVVKRDYVGFTLFLLLTILVNVLGFVCCFVGLLVSFPVTIVATAVAYRELVGFEQRTIDALNAGL